MFSMVSKVIKQVNKQPGIILTLPFESIALSAKSESSFFYETSWIMDSNSSDSSIIEYYL